MTIVACPRCHERVSLPLSASAAARVRCPLCQETLWLAEILDALPPELEVLEDPGRASSEAAGLGEPSSLSEAPRNLGEPRPSAEAVGDLGESSLPAVEEPASLPEFRIDRSSQAQEPRATTSGTRRRRKRSRSRRKSKNAVGEVVKIVAGGIAGLVMAQLLLWWMPWQNLRRDPFQLGPPVAALVPWLVPATFHGAVAVADTAAHRAAPTAPDDGLSETGMPERTFEQADRAAESPTWEAQTEARKEEPEETLLGYELPEHEPIDESSASPIPGTDPGDLDDLYDLGPTLTEPVAPPDDPLLLDPDWPEDSQLEWAPDLELDPPLEGMSDLETDPGLEIAPATETDPELGDIPELNEQTATDEQETDARGEAGNEAPSAVASLSEPEPEPEDETLTAVGDTIFEEAQQAALAWSKVAVAESGALLGSTYRTLARLCEALHRSEPDAEAERELAIELLKSLREDPDKLRNLGRAGTAWFHAPDRRDSDGVLLVGKVQAIFEQGPLYRTELALPDNTTVAAVYADTDPSDWYQLEDRVLIAGKFIPSSTLSELPPDVAVEAEVVWSSVVAVVTD